MRTFVSDKVLVFEFTFKHVGEGSHAPVRVIRKSGSLADFELRRRAGSQQAIFPERSRIVRYQA